MTKKVTGFGPIGNEVPNLGKFSKPYTATIRVKGTAKMLMHCWNIAAIEEKSTSKKGSKEKKTDNVESYVLRDDSGNIVMPTINFCASIRMAGKSFSDPSSPRKSLHDRLKAVIIPVEEYGLVNGGTKDWDFIDARRVVIQRAGITRHRPAFFEGWEIVFKIAIMEPEYLQPDLLYELISTAGKFQGLGDFRPTFGRFVITAFDTDQA
jgi:hypothetical protein